MRTNDPTPSPFTHDVTTEPRNGWRDEALALLETRDGTLDCVYDDDVSALAGALQGAYARGLAAAGPLVATVGADGGPIPDGIVVDPRDVICMTASAVPWPSR